MFGRAGHRGGKSAVEVFWTRGPDSGSPAGRRLVKHWGFGDTMLHTSHKTKSITYLLVAGVGWLHDQCAR